MTVGELKEKLSKFPDDMEIDSCDGILISEYYKHPARGWVSLVSWNVGEEIPSRSDIVEKRVRFETKRDLFILCGV